MNTVEIQLLAEQALGLTPDQVDTLIDNGEDYDTPLKESFGVDLETFGRIANALIPLTPVIEQPKTNQLIHAFIQFRDGRSTVIAKEAIHN
ncbi:MAG: hypothetical protein WBA64_04685 [Marinomonas sp.]|uniref:hypothetical protein n=1 Tax=Marinomonas sp. TaxID=1904862 RepID=UPI003C72CB20